MTTNLSFNPNFAGCLQFKNVTVTEEDKNSVKDPLPLRYKWVLWEQLLSNQSKQAKYADATQRVGSFESVQDFWKYWNHLPQPSELVQNKKMVHQRSDGLYVIDALMIFQDGIRPEWEDEKNATGGHFQCALKATQSQGLIDEYWNNLVLGLVGSTIEPSHLIMGVRLVDKTTSHRQQQIRVEIWFSEATAEEKELLRKNLEDCLSQTLDGNKSKPPKLEIKMHQQTGHTPGRETLGAEKP
jgi:translation initiation factor 4E